MKTFIVIFLLSLSYFSCSPQQVEEKEDNKMASHKLIPQDEYISFPKECSKKLMNFKLLEQMSVKNYLYKNDEISEDDLKQKVILYFTEEPSKIQKAELEKESAFCNWESWTPPAENHPFGFVLAELKIKNASNVICLDFVKKIDTGEDKIDPAFLEKLKRITD